MTHVGQTSQVKEYLDLAKSHLVGGNQRDLARQKNQKKQQELAKKKAAGEKTGMSLQERKHRDAELMREKQRKKEEQAEAAKQEAVH